MNSCSFIGNLGKDAEMQQAGNSTICKFSIANSVGYGDKKTTMWISCNLWGVRGQKLQPHLVKGMKVLVIGELSQTEYNSKTYLNLNVNQVELLSDRQQQSQAAPAQQYSQPQAQPAQQYAQPQAAQPAQQQGEFNPFDSIPGGVPF